MNQGLKRGQNIMRKERRPFESTEAGDSSLRKRNNSISRGGFYHYGEPRFHQLSLLVGLLLIDLSLVLSGGPQMPGILSDGRDSNPEPSLLLPKVLALGKLVCEGGWLPSTGLTRPLCSYHL